MLAAVVSAGLLLGLLIRLYALGRETITSDNAVVGLMAREILHGHFFAFYWGQSYGGPEAYPVAAVFAVFGASPFTLGLTAVLLVSGSLYLLWRVGNRLFASPVGAIAAVAFWLWPETYLSASTTEDGFRWLVLDCGLAVLLTVLRIGDGEATVADWAVLGLASGVGFWSSPEIAYFLLPAGAYLLIRLAQRRASFSPAWMAAGVATALLGSLPWWWHNLGHHFDSLSAPNQPKPPGGQSAYWYHFDLFTHILVPMVLGLRLHGTGAWLAPVPAAKALAVAGVAVALVWLAYLAARGRAWVLVAYVAAFPFVYAASPFSWYWQDGRYAVFLAPAAALVVASFVCEMARGLLRSPRLPMALAAVLVVAGSLVLTVDAARHFSPFSSLPSQPTVERTSWRSWQTNPNNLLQAVADDLVARHVTDAFAGYWVAYDLGFLAHGNLTVTASGPDFVRYPPYFAAVAASPRPAWVFSDGPNAITAAQETAYADPGCVLAGQTCLVASQLEQYLQSHDIAYNTLVIGPYVVVLPASRVVPSEVFPEFNI